MNVLARVDHLVYATPDLVASVEDLATRLGVQPAPGGRHPAWGTRNAVVSLAAEIYLEIIGPDLQSPPPAHAPRPFAIDELTTGRLVTWAAKRSDLDDAVLQARRHGVELGPVQSGARSRPDGVVLSWKLTDVFQPRADGIIPFLIDWGSTPHPARTAPQGCSLLQLRAEHPHAERVNALLSALGLDFPVQCGSVPRLFATIETPRGIMELT